MILCRTSTRPLQSPLLFCSSMLLFNNFPSPLCSPAPYPNPVICRTSGIRPKWTEIAESLKVTIFRTRRNHTDDYLSERCEWMKRSSPTDLNSNRISDLLALALSPYPSQLCDSLGNPKLPFQILADMRVLFELRNIWACGRF